MLDLLNGFDNILPHLKTLALLVALVLGVIAAAAAVYIVQALCAPTLRLVQWLFAYEPSADRQNDVVAGISFGGRILAWSGLIAVVVYFLARGRG
jgi:hypothetical protein